MKLSSEYTKKLQLPLVDFYKAIDEHYCELDVQRSQYEFEYGDDSNDKFLYNEKDNVTYVYQIKLGELLRSTDNNDWFNLYVLLQSFDNASSPESFCIQVTDFAKKNPIFKKIITPSFNKLLETIKSEKLYGINNYDNNQKLGEYAHLIGCFMRIEKEYNTDNCWKIVDILNNFFQAINSVYCALFIKKTRIAKTKEFLSFFEVEEKPEVSYKTEMVVGDLKNSNSIQEWGDFYFMLYTLVNAPSLENLQIKLWNYSLAHDIPEEMKKIIIPFLKQFSEISKKPTSNDNNNDIRYGYGSY